MLSLPVLTSKSELYYTKFQSYAGRPRMLILAKADLVKREEIDMICKQISVQENIPVYSTANTVCIM